MIKMHYDCLENFIELEEGEKEETLLEYPY